MVVRMFGALILGQSWLVWNARSITDGEIRRAFVQARRITLFVRPRFSCSALRPPPRSLMQPRQRLTPTCCSRGQAYFGVFTASTVALLRSHLSDPYWHPVRNPMVILAFGFLALFYGWFALFQKPVVFEGLPKTVQ